MTNIIDCIDTNRINFKIPEFINCKLPLIKKGNLSVIAARPGMGKTALALHLIHEVSLQHETCLYLSLNETKNVLAEMFLKIFSHAGGSKKAIERLKKLPIFIKDSLDLNKETICSYIIEQNKERKVAFFVIDFLQLIQNYDKQNGLSNKKHYQKVIIELRTLARKLNIGILVLSQLDKKIEKRKNKMPKFEDINAFGHLSFYIDSLIYLYRWNYYLLSNDNKFLLQIASKINSNNHGLETVECEFLLETLTFKKYKNE